MAVEILRPWGQDAAEAVAQVALSKRDVLLHVYQRRLRWEDLEDCYSQATLELVIRAKRGTRFASPRHISNALEQKFVSRINDRHRAMGGRSASEAALSSALSVEEDASGVTQVVDLRAPVDDQVMRRQDLCRLREVAQDLSSDQRLVLACQVSLGMDSREFCRRYGWSSEKFRKVAQRARAKLRVLVMDYQSGARCRQLEPALLALVAGVASEPERQRATLHVENCTGCASMVRDLERAGHDVARVFVPVLGVTGGMGARLAAMVAGVSRRLERLAPGSHVAPAAAGAGGAAGGGAVLSAGGSVLGLGAVKLGVAALCVAGFAGGYAVCARTGLLGPDHPSARPPLVRVAERSGPRQRDRSAVASQVPSTRTAVIAVRPVAVSDRRPRVAQAASRPGVAQGGAARRQAQREFGVTDAARARSAQGTRLHPDVAAPLATRSSFEGQVAASHRAASSGHRASGGAANEFGFAG